MFVVSYDFNSTHVIGIKVTGHFFKHTVDVI